MNWLLYHYHKWMKRRMANMGVWQTHSFMHHRRQMKKYEGRLHNGRNERGTDISGTTAEEEQ